jgi:hypothetical protein
MRIRFYYHFFSLIFSNPEGKPLCPAHPPHSKKKTKNKKKKTNKQTNKQQKTKTKKQPTHSWIKERQLLINISGSSLRNGLLPVKRLALC